MKVTNLNKEEILKLLNKAGAYEFGRQKGYQDGCKSGVKQAKEDFKRCSEECREKLEKGELFCKRVNIDAE